MKKLLLAAAALLVHLCATAQFYLIGTAQYMDDPDCIQLTPDVPYSEGIAYSTTLLDLSRYFEIQFEIYLGDKDVGADGITFVIHNDVRGFEAFGTWGECMGYGRWAPESYANSIDPSIAIEFDTYQNYRQNDPACDHIAYLENGISRHQVYWNNNDPGYNMEDDRLHDFRFRWEPNAQQITVLLYGNIVYTGNKDLKKDIFSNVTQVIWGFSASTGYKHNLQYFCLRRIAYFDSKPWKLNLNIFKTD